MRWALLLGAVIVAGLGVFAAVTFGRHPKGRVERGSPTVAFVPTLTVAGVARHPAGIVWPAFGYDTARLHVAPGVTLRPPYRTLWVAGGRSLLEFPPAIAYGRLYVATAAGEVLALSAATGLRAWRYEAHRCAAASPAVGPFKGGAVYEAFLNRLPCKAKLASDGEVVALAAGTGQVRWRRRIGASETSPLLAYGRVYVGDWLGMVYALDARTGRVDWSFETGGAVKGGVALSGNRVFVGSYDGDLYALDAATGHLLWRAAGLSGSGAFYSTPSVAYGRVYIGSTDDRVYSFGAPTGSLSWSFRTGGYVYGSPAVWKGLVLVGSYDHTFYALDAADGRERWRFSANGPISGSATVVDGIVYFATLRGRTYALDASSGRLVWSFPDGRYAPVVADRRRLYLIGYSRIYGLVSR